LQQWRRHGQQKGHSDLADLIRDNEAFTQVRTNTDMRPVLLVQLSDVQVPLSGQRNVDHLKIRQLVQDGTRVLSQRMEWRQAVQCE
jgi:23S rRNA U2552 (ribose-2'-O)-methylase RlmE/FtsJ